MRTEHFSLLLIVVGIIGGAYYEHKKLQGQKLAFKVLIVCMVSNLLGIGGLLYLVLKGG